MLDDGGKPSNSGRHHRGAAGHGFQRNQTKAFVVGRNHADVGCVVIKGQFFVVHLTNEVYLPFQVPFLSEQLHAVHLTVAVHIGANHDHSDSVF